MAWSMRIGWAAARVTVLSAVMALSSGPAAVSASAGTLIAPASGVSSTSHSTIEHAPAAHPRPSLTAPPWLSLAETPKAGVEQPRTPTAKGCDLWDISCKSKEAINNWLKGLAKSAITSVFNSLGPNLLQTPQVDRLPRVGGLWERSSWVANTCFVLLVIAGGLVLMGYETLQTSYTLKDIAPRVATGFILANASRELTSKAIEFANALSSGLIGRVDVAAAMDTLQQRLERAEQGSDFLVVVLFIAAVLTTVLAILFALRVTLTLLLVVAAPLALACHALPQTEQLARLWWRAMTGLLAIQVAQALTFSVLTTVMFTAAGPESLTGSGQLWDMLLLICLLYIMIRIPSWVAFQVMNGGTRRSPITRAARLILYRRAITSSVRRINRRP